MSCNCSRYRSIEDMREKNKRDNIGHKKHDSYKSRGSNRCNQSSSHGIRCKDRK